MTRGIYAKYHYKPCYYLYKSGLIIGNHKIREFCHNKDRLRAVPLQSVESKLGRTGESEMAERETGETRLLPSFPSASCFLLSLASLNFLARVTILRDDQIKQKHLLLAMKKWLTEDGVVLGWYNSKSLLYTPKHWQSMDSFMEDESHNLTNFCMFCQFVVSYHLRDYKNI